MSYLITLLIHGECSTRRYYYTSSGTLIPNYSLGLLNVEDSLLDELELTLKEQVPNLLRFSTVELAQKYLISNGLTTNHLVTPYPVDTLHQ